MSYSNINDNYSSIRQDPGYKVMKSYKCISHKFPYTRDIHPRLVSYLREYYFNKINGIHPCVPLSSVYSIRECDIASINNYLKRHRIVM